MSNKLPKDWKHINLGSIGKVKGGKRLPKGHTYATEITNLPYIRVTDFGNQTINFEKLKHLNTDTQKAIKNYTISSEDVYISIAGTIGVTGIIPQKLNGANLTENAAKITELIDCDKKFLSRFLSSLDGQSQIKESTKTTTQPKLSLYRIAEIIIPLPPLETQHAIVSKIEELFSELDKGIEDLKTAQLQLKTYRQAVLKYAFEGKLTNKKVKDGVLPKGWEMVELAKLSSFHNGDRSKKYPNKSEYVNSNEGVAFINTGHIEPNGKLSLDKMNYISKDKLNSLSGGKITNGDLVYCLRGATIGKTAIVDQFNEGTVASSLVIIRANEAVYNRYIYYFLISPLCKNYIKLFDNGTAQPNLSAKSVSKYMIPQIKFNLQINIVQEIESRLSVADKMEESIAHSLLQAESLRQSILKKAFSGELV